MKTSKEKRVEVCSLTHNTLGVKGHAGALGWGLRRMISGSIIHTNLHKPNKLVGAWLEHLWCMDKPRTYTNSQDSSRPGLGGNHHLSLYSIICAWLHGLHPYVSLSWDSQIGSLKIFEIGILATLEAHNFFTNL